ncbi:MAG: hypothetical protein RIT38_163 [Bacteroidota bacterium]|jgi:L-aspartate oxidase
MGKDLKYYDAIIVGTGVAGLSSAIYIAEKARKEKKQFSILVLAKGQIETTNTNWAQGGIASVKLPHDSFEAHIQDTMDAGGGVNDLYIVEKVVKAAPGAIEDLIQWGIEFDQDTNGQYDLAKEGGHQHERIWHHADITGAALQKVLIDKVKTFDSITIYPNTTVLAVQYIKGQYVLTTIKNEDALNAYQVDNHQQFKTSQLVLATGGLGMVYQNSTNQSVATGDGLYLAKQLNAKFKDLSFIQFHPTGLYEPNVSNTFLITEALRGAGAILRNEQGQDFMPLYDTRGALAPRDIVSRAIVAEIKKSTIGHVFLDATGLSQHQIEMHFPNIASACQFKLGIDIQTQWIPVIPVEHYACGGIAVNDYGLAINHKGLYAIGETASTGLHGANRLASNSLLEALVYAKWVADEIVSNALLSEEQHQFDFETADITLKQLDRQKLQYCLTNYAGIEKSTEGLQAGLAQLEHAINTAPLLKEWTLEDWENNVMYTIGVAIFNDALVQKDNKGVFFNIDLV